MPWHGTESDERPSQQDIADLESKGRFRFDEVARPNRLVWRTENAKKTLAGVRCLVRNLMRRKKLGMGYSIKKGQILNPL